MSKRVLITGGASGLGKALAEAHLARGDKVLVADLKIDGAPAGAEAITLDVTSEADWSAAREWVEANWGGLDYLYNNAGIASGGRIDVASMAEWDRVIEINLLSVVKGVRAFVSMFKAQKSGHIINTASMAGLLHAPAMAPYNATKAGVVAISETLGHELAPWGIAVTAVCPTFFRTNLATSFAGEDPITDKIGHHLLKTSTWSAEKVAKIVLAGVDKKRDVIITGPESRRVYYVKKFARPLYNRVARREAMTMAKKSGEL